MQDSPYAFVSYSHHDQGYVEQLVGFLASRGIELRRDLDIRKGDRYIQALADMVRNASVVLVVMTPEAAASEHVEREIIWAEDAGVPIFPLLLRGAIFPQLVNKQISQISDNVPVSDAIVHDIQARLQSSAPADTESRFDPRSTVSFSDKIAKYVDSDKARRAAVKVKATSELASRMQFGEMLTHLDEALAIDPDFVPAHINRAFALNALQRWDDALAAADRAAVLDPKAPLAHQHRAVALAGLGRWSDALPATERGIALDPENAQAHLQRAYVLGRLRRWSEAVHELDRVLEISPGLKHAQILRRFATVGKWAGKLGLRF